VNPGGNYLITMWIVLAGKRYGNGMADADASPTPPLRPKYRWRRPTKYRPNGRTTEGKRAKAFEIELCQQLGKPYHALPGSIRATVDAAVVATLRMAAIRVSLTRGLPIDDTEAQRWAGILQRSLEALGLLTRPEDDRAEQPPHENYWDKHGIK
jgi:hypothetical protein